MTLMIDKFAKRKRRNRSSRLRKLLKKLKSQSLRKKQILKSLEKHWVIASIKRLLSVCCLCLWFCHCWVHQRLTTQQTILSEKHFGLEYQVAMIQMVSFATQTWIHLIPLSPQKDGKKSSEEWLEVQKTPMNKDKENCSGCSYQIGTIRVLLKPLTMLNSPKYLFLQKLQKMYIIGNKQKIVQDLSCQKNVNGDMRKWAWLATLRKNALMTHQWLVTSWLLMHGTSTNLRKQMKL